MVTFAVIIMMLMLVYRSIVTVLIVLAMVFLGLSATRGVVAFLGFHELIGLSTFATNLLVTLAIAATTDYAIFLIGRYQEARTIGECWNPSAPCAFVDGGKSVPSSCGGRARCCSGRSRSRSSDY